jgi:CRISPR-associated endonuclease Csy4
MDSYLDLTLLPDPEFAANLLLNALYAKLHRVLAGQGGGDIGVSFPKVSDKGLGSVLRLHGSAAALATLNATDWLAGMRDHLAISAVKPVPAGAKHRLVRRVQTKSNPERLRRRLIKRKGIDAEQARQAIPDSKAKSLSLPFVVLRSQSTGQQFRLFIEHRPLRAQALEGPFSAYGLSPTATVPWF